MKQHNIWITTKWKNWKMSWKCFWKNLDILACPITLNGFWKWREIQPILLKMPIIFCHILSVIIYSQKVFITLSKCKEEKDLNFLNILYWLSTGCLIIWLPFGWKILDLVQQFYGLSSILWQYSRNFSYNKNFGAVFLNFLFILFW